MDFEQRLQRLELIGEQIRDAKVPLETAASLFEEGLLLAKALDGELRSFERKIEILVNQPDSPGEAAEFEPFPELSTPELRPEK